MGAGSISVAVMTPDQERAAIVAWLRKGHEIEFGITLPLNFAMFLRRYLNERLGTIADAIARGDHKGE